MSFRGKQFIVSVVLVAVAVVVGSLYAEHELEGELVKRTEAELLARARAATVVLQALANTNANLDQIADDLGHANSTRITIVDATGHVVGDSDLTPAQLAMLDNHSDRPEVKDALRSGTGVSRRRSATVDVDLLYVASAFSTPAGKGVVRAALPLTILEQAMSSVRSLLVIAGLVSLIIGIITSALASHLISRRLLDLVKRVPRSSMAPDTFDDEVDSLSRGVDALSTRLENTIVDLSTERERVTALLRTMTEGVIALDDAEKVLLMNPAAQHVFDASVSVDGELRSPHSEALKGLVARLLSSQKLAETMELECRPADAAQDDAPRRVTVRVARQEHGIGIVLVAHDITDVRRLENVRRDFVANVSHELRTPCSVILANAETLLSGAVDDPHRAQKFIEAIHRNAARLSQLIADLLEISRIEAGKQVFRRVQLKLLPVVEHVIEAMEPRARDKDLTLRIDVDRTLQVDGDAKALEQILVNLIDNAVKYTPNQGHVVVRAARSELGITLTVEDDGPGVAAKHKGRLFERFYRVDPGRSRDVGGTGLGLAIVKHLVEAMDWTIVVEDSKPHGTRFVVTFARAPS